MLNITIKVIGLSALFVLFPIIASCAKAPIEISSYIEPLPVSYLSDIDNPVKDELKTKLVLVDLNPPSPQQPIVIGLEYRTGSNELFGSGELWDHSVTYDYQFDPTYIPLFIDLIEYIENRPDVFFDYDEFEGVPKGQIQQIGKSVLMFSILMQFYNGGEVDYAIDETLDPNEIASPEFQHVIDIMRNTFMAEIIQHPYTLPSTKPNPSRWIY
jgi:hypothetical protein